MKPITLPVLSLGLLSFVQGDLHAGLLVESGGQVTAGNLIIGAADATGPTAASGQVTVQGLESALYATSLQIGNVTDGDLKIRAGGTVSVMGDVDLGQADAVGSLLIEGSGSSLSFNISQLATLSLNITDPLTLNSYTLLNAIDGIVDNTAEGFILDGVIPTGFELVYSEYRVELVRLPAQFGTVTARL